MHPCITKIISYDFISKSNHFISNSDLKEERLLFLYYCFYMQLIFVVIFFSSATNYCIFLCQNHRTKFIICHPPTNCTNSHLLNIFIYFITYCFIYVFNYNWFGFFYFVLPGLILNLLY